jgi:hypothetical protein
MDLGVPAGEFSGCCDGADEVKLELSPMMMFEWFTLPLMIMLLSPAVFLFEALVLRGILVNHSQLEIFMYYTAGPNKKVLSFDRTFFDV